MNPDLETHKHIKQNKTKNNKTNNQTCFKTYKLRKTKLNKHIRT